MNQDEQPNENIVAEKAALRRQLRRARMAIRGQARKKAEAKVVRLLKPWLARGKKIGFYWAVGSELSLAPLVAMAQKRGARLYLPYIESGRQRLWFTPYQQQPFARQKCGLAIPQVEGKKIRTEDLDILLLPLIGVDATGLRMGQGGGFYDVSLAACRYRCPLLIGVGFACQMVAHLPAEPHDKRLDWWVSEEGVRCFRG